MTDLRSRVLATLENRQLSTTRLGRTMGFGPAWIDRELKPLLIAMQKDGVIGNFGGNWQLAKPKVAKSAPVVELRPLPAIAAKDPEAAPDSHVAADIPNEKPEANGGDDALPRRPHRITTDMKRKAADQKAQITELLKRHGALTAPHVLELLADPSLTMKDVQNRLTYMRQTGLIEPTGHGYSLTKQTKGSDDVDGAPPAEPNAGEATASASTAPADESVERGDTADDLPDEYENGVGLNTRDPGAVELTVEARGEEVAGTVEQFSLGVSRMCDIRAKLMEMADLVRDNKLNREQVELMLKILNHAASIDQAAEAA